MLISVVIPTYNRAWSLPRAVNSVLKQTFRDLELIVVDDGSNDYTQNILSSYQDSRLRVIRQTNRGVAGSRNRGIEESRGDYIALLDSDDYWFNQKMKRHLEFTLDSGFSITQTEEIWIRKGRRVNPKYKHTKKAGWIFEPSLQLCLVSPSCVMFSRDCWKKIGPFDQDLMACEDYDLWLRASLNYPIGLLPERLVCKYGGHPDQLSGRILGLDLYRIYSLGKLLTKYSLTEEQRILALKEFRKRVSYYIQGCLKRDKQEEVGRINSFKQKVLEKISIN